MANLISNVIDHLDPVNWDPKGPLVKGISFIPVVSYAFMHLTTRHFKTLAKNAVSTPPEKPDECEWRMGKSPALTIVQRANKFCETVKWYGLAQLVIFAVILVFGRLSPFAHNAVLVFATASQLIHWLRARDVANKLEEILKEKPAGQPVKA